MRGDAAVARRRIDIQGWFDGNRTCSPGRPAALPALSTCRRTSWSTRVSRPTTSRSPRGAQGPVRARARRRDPVAPCSSRSTFGRCRKRRKNRLDSPASSRQRSASPSLTRKPRLIIVASPTAGLYPEERNRFKQPSRRYRSSHFGDLRPTSSTTSPTCVGGRAHGSTAIVANDTHAALYRCFHVKVVARTIEAELTAYPLAGFA